MNVPSVIRRPDVRLGIAVLGASWLLAGTVSHYANLPRVNVSWSDQVTSAEQSVLEARFSLTSAVLHVAAALRAQVRTYDLWARLGGDEFVVVLWQCAAEQAEQKRRDLQTAIPAARFETESGDVLSLGISAGVAVLDEDGATADQLLAVADQRMYIDKSARRTQVERATPAAS